MPKPTGSNGKCGLKVVVPASVEDQTYIIRAGIWNSKTHKRRMLSSRRDSFGKVPLGELHVSAEDSTVQCKPTNTNPGLNSGPAAADLSEPVDFGWCKTTIGVRAQKDRDGVWITPLPNESRIPFHLNLDTFGLSSAVEVVAESFDGKTVAVETDHANGYVSWDLEADLFRYRVD